MDNEQLTAIMARKALGTLTKEDVEALIAEVLSLRGIEARAKDQLRLTALYTGTCGIREYNLLLLILGDQPALEGANDAS